MTVILKSWKLIKKVEVKRFCEQFFLKCKIFSSINIFIFYRSYYALISFEVFIIFQKILRFTLSVKIFQFFLNYFRFSFFTLLCPSKIVILFIFYFRVDSTQDSKTFQINKIKLENWNFFDKETLRLFRLISIWRVMSIIENLHHF